jgi:hypothetical protein
VKGSIITSERTGENGAYTDPAFPLWSVLYLTGYSVMPGVYRDLMTGQEVCLPRGGRLPRGENDSFTCYIRLKQPESYP